jgi:hypothetical protein
MKSKVCCAFKSIPFVLLMVPSVADAVTPVTRAISPAFLGDSIELGVLGVRGQCVEGDIVYEGDAQSTLLIDEPMPFEELERRFTNDPSLNESARAMVSGQRSTFVDALRPSSTAASVIYGFEVGQRWASLGSPRISAVGKDQLSRSERTRRGACGNAVLARAELGGALYIGLRFDFDSKATKDEFEKAADLPLASFASITAKMSRMTTAFESKVSVTLSAYQRGGNPALLHQVFGAGGGPIAVLQCSEANVQGCADATENVRRYVSDANGFRSQLGEDVRLTPGGATGPVVLRFEAKTYDELGLPELATPNLDAVMLAGVAPQKRVAIEALQVQERIEGLSTVDRGSVQVRRDLEDWHDRLLYAIRACASSPELCAEAADDALTIGRVP